MGPNMIYRLHSMQWPAGEVRYNGVWPPTPCSSVFRHACRSSFAGGFRVSVSWRHSDSVLVLDTSCSTPGVSWQPPLASLSVSLCGLRPRSSLLTCCRASLEGLNSSSRPLLPFACSTLRCGVGRGSFWVGRLVLPSHLSSWSLVGQMLSTSPLVGCCPSLVGCTQCLRATDVHFLL